MNTRASAARTPRWPLFAAVFTTLLTKLASAQQCYVAPGVIGPSNLVSCTGASGGTCCLQGDFCLNGNACYNSDTQNTYQYGCADSSYSASTCPFKCGWDVSQSPWVGLGYCGEVGNTWTCFAPESCGCIWPSPSSSLAKLPSRSCKDMGDNARVAMYAPLSLGGWASLPATSGSPISTYGPATLYTQVEGVVRVFSATSTSSTSTSTTSISSTSSTTSTKSSPSSTASSTPISSTSTTTISPSSTVSFSTSSTSSTADSTSAPDTGSSLSTGAKAGIGAGVGAGALVVIAALAALLMARRRRSLRDGSDPSGQHMPEKGHHSWAASTMSERRY